MYVISAIYSVMEICRLSTRKLGDMVSVVVRSWAIFEAIWTRFGGRISQIKNYINSRMIDGVAVALDLC